MATQRVTIELPEPVFRQLARIAQATHQPVEALVAQSVISNLPPSADNASPELQLELLRMQTLNTEELRAIAKSASRTRSTRAPSRTIGKKSSKPAESSGAAGAIGSEACL
jgi:hypothetical protein